MSYSGSNRRWGTVVFLTSLVVFALIVFGRGVPCRLLPALPGCAPPLATPAATPAAASSPAPTGAAGTVLVYLYSANSKENWIDAVKARFNQAQVKTSLGNPIFVTVKHGASGPSRAAILAGAERPQAWSPGDQSWVDGANQSWLATTGSLLVPDDCRPTVYAPVGFAMWRPMAEAMGWPDRPIGWDELVALAADPQGWGRYDHAEWGQFQFGHTHPESTAGLLILATLVHDVLGQAAPLAPAQVFSPEVIEAMRTVEAHTYHYGAQSRDLLNLMIKRGMSYLHAINTTEPETLKTNAERGGEMAQPLVFIFPANGTFWTDQPYCVIDADWVTEEQAEAARIFGDYLLHPDQQALAVENYVRPTISGIALACPLCLEQGTDPRVTSASVPALPSPSDEVASAVTDAWLQTKKKATVIVVLDTSQSMQEEHKLTSAISGTLGFLGRLHPDDEVIVMTFDSAVDELEPAGRAGEVSEELMGKVSGLYPSGNTALRDAVCAAAQRASTLQAEDVEAGENRLYGVVVLSDGADSASAISEAEMFATCLPTGVEVEGIKIFTIAYGAAANTDLLKRIAESTGGRSFEANPANIDAVYQAISAEQ